MNRSSCNLTLVLLCLLQPATAKSQQQSNQICTVDFSFSRGSLILNVVEKEGGNRQSIRIVGPEDPLTKPEVIIEHVRYAGELKESMRVLNANEIREFVAKRILSEPDISDQEAGFLAALLLHSSGSAQIKIWGVSGWRHLKDGNWTKLFREREQSEAVLPPIPKK